VSIEEYVRELKTPPDVHIGFSVSVQWLDAAGSWLVTIDEPYRTETGAILLGKVWQRRYGDLEAGTAYQATMLALSDWRQNL
jgi:hypothetical protein